MKARYLIFTLLGLAILFTLFIGVRYLVKVIGGGIIIQRQRVVGSVQVEKVFVKEPAFLVLRFQDNSSNPGTLLTATPLLPPGTYEDLILPLQLEASGDLDPQNTPQFVPGSLIFASLIKDVDGNGIFDPDTDTEMSKDLLGNDITINFSIK